MGDSGLLQSITSSSSTCCITGDEGVIEGS